MKRIAPFILIVLSLACMPAALAHQPRIVVDEDTVEISDPEISKAFYAELEGEPETYTIVSGDDFALYVGITVPDIPEVETDYVIDIHRGDELLERIDGAEYEWLPMHEPFAGDVYLSGPEYRRQAGPGTYRIVVSSPDNTGKYVLAVGEIEAFPFSEIVNAYREIPRLKAGYFGKPRAQFMLSVFGSVYVLLALICGIVIGILYRTVLRAVARKKMEKGQFHPAKRNIGRADRVFRTVLAVLLLLWGLWSWSGILMLASGFVFYEAVAGWCAVYAALGKNTCPMT